MSIKKIGIDEIKKFKNCKTEDDFKGFARDMGIELSEADLDDVCGGLAQLESKEAFKVFADKVNQKQFAERDSRVLLNDSFEDDSIWLKDESIAIF